MPSWGKTMALCGPGGWCAQLGDITSEGSSLTTLLKLPAPFQLGAVTSPFLGFKALFSNCSSLLYLLECSLSECFAE